MNDERILNKNKQFQNSKIETAEDFLKIKENNKLSLRKEKIEDIFMKSRMKITDNSDLEINVNKLEISKEIIDISLLNTPPVNKIINTN